MILGTEIRRQAKNKNISLRKLASLLGMTNAGLIGTIDSPGIKLSTLLEICRHLEISPGTLLGSTDQQNGIKKYIEQRLEELELKVARLEAMQMDNNTPPNGQN